MYLVQIGERCGNKPFPLLRRAVCCAFVIVMCLACSPGFADDFPLLRHHTLRVALYPYIPRVEQYEKAIAASWAQLEPRVALRFVDWDCYVADPPTDVDVFVFDAIYLRYYQKMGYLEPVYDWEIENLRDILNFAVEGGRINGRLYGIPQLGCTHLLYYRKDDLELAQAETLDEILSVIGICPFSGLLPPHGQGLMVGLEDDVTPDLYVDAVQDLTGIYDPDPYLPPADQLNEEALAHVQDLLLMSNRTHAAYVDEDYDRGRWFGQGLGRALIDYSEAMSAMGEGLKDVRFKLLPLGNGVDVPLFYADLIGINPRVSARGVRGDALKLANLVASTRVVLASMLPTSQAPQPQYTIPVRHSVFRILALLYPHYDELYRLVQASHPKLFLMGADYKEWMEDNQEAIQERVYSASTCD